MGGADVNSEGQDDGLDTETAQGGNEDGDADPDRDGEVRVANVDVWVTSELVFFFSPPCGVVGSLRMGMNERTS